MKKQTYLIILLFLIGLTTVIATNIINFNDIESAKIYIDNLKETQKSEMDKINFEYVYTTDKICEYDFDVDDFICSICYNLTKPYNTERCAFLQKDTTRIQDDETILMVIKERYKQTLENEEVTVNLREEKGRVTK